MNHFLDTDDESLLINTDHELEIKFEPERENLAKDISTLDIQISNIQKHIVVLESTINSIEQALNNPANKGNTQFDRPKFIGALNKTLEILALYHGNYQRFYDLKYKYRKEQDDLKFRVVRLVNVELEATKGTSNSDLIDVLRRIDFNDPKSSSKIVDEINKVNKDPDYEL
jgi:hypothetical protein